MVTYRIDSECGVVLTTATGVLTEEDLLTHKHALRRDPDFRPGMVELSDVRGIERLQLTSDGVRRLVADDESDAGRMSSHKLAIVVSREVVFGMARMYGTLTQEHLPNLGVFRDMEEAKAWLGIR